jgi:hypothetical protein
VGAGVFAKRGEGFVHAVGDGRVRVKLEPGERRRESRPERRGHGEGSERRDGGCGHGSHAGQQGVAGGRGRALGFVAGLCGGDCIGSHGPYLPSVKVSERVGRRGMILRLGHSC